MEKVRVTFVRSFDLDSGSVVYQVQLRIEGNEIPKILRDEVVSVFGKPLTYQWGRIDHDGGVCYRHVSVYGREGDIYTAMDEAENRVTHALHTLREVAEKNRHILSQLPENLVDAYYI